MQKYTWVSPDEIYKNQIYHTLVNIRFENSIYSYIVNVRILRSADMNSNHLLLIIWIKVKLKRHTENNLKITGQFNIEKLEDQEISKNFENSIKYVF